MRYSVLRACLVLLGIVQWAGCSRPPAEPVRPPFRVRVVLQEPVGRALSADVEALEKRLQGQFGLDASRVVVEAPRDRRGALRRLGEDGIELVIALGVPLGRQARAEAMLHPESAFISQVGPPREPNLAVLNFQRDGAAYLAGVAAALAGGSRVGVVSDAGETPSSSLVSSFRRGCRSRVVAARIEVVTGPDGVRELARRGVRVAFYTGERLLPEILAAAETSGLDLIVSGSERPETTPDVVLATIEIDLVEALVRITRDVLDGTFGGREYRFDLGSGVVDLKLEPRFVSMAGRDAVEALEEARAAVNAGMVEVEVLGL